MRGTFVNTVTLLSTLASTLNPHPAFNPQSTILTFSTINHQPSTINPQSSTQALMREMGMCTMSLCAFHSMALLVALCTCAYMHERHASWWHAGAHVHVYMGTFACASACPVRACAHACMCARAHVRALNGGRVHAHVLARGHACTQVLNYVLYGPMIRQKLDLRRELKSHAASTAVAAAVGGYSNYLGLSDTAIHRLAFRALRGDGEG